MRQDERAALEDVAASRSWPLSRHLGLLCGVLLLPVLVLEIFLLFSIASGERAQHEAVARDAARRIATSLDRGLATLGSVAEVLATSDHLLGNDLGSFKQRLQQLPRISEAGVVLRSEEGEVLLAAGAVPPGQRDPSAEAAARLTGRPQFSGLLHDGSASAPGFSVIVPVRDDRLDPSGRTLSLRVPAAELDRLLRREGVPPGMIATITDRAGTVLARTRDGPRLVGTRIGRMPPREEDAEGWRRGTNADGEPIVVAYAQSEIAGWTAWVFMSEHEFTAPLRRSLSAAVVLAGLFAGFAAILAVCFARRIALPITTLAQAVKTGEDAPPATPIREVNAVADAYASARAEAQRLRDMQMKLRQAARVNEMGMLAAGLAHEINQPLTAATAFAEGALRLMPDVHGDPRLAAARDAVREAAAQAVRAGRIVGRLRGFLAASDGERTPTDLNALLREAARLAATDAQQRGVALRLELEPGLPLVTLDPVQVGQVMVNLIRNGIEAMSSSERKELGVASRRPGNGLVEVSVADTGAGIATEVIDRLFSPFVTSKPGGMGVGLAIARGIIEEHGGRLDWVPNPEGGAVFRFSLPLGTEAPMVMEGASHAR